MPAHRAERQQPHEDPGSAEPVSIRSLSVEFGTAGGATPRRVLSDVSLHVPTGQLLALIGPSGSGKTTILNVVSGLVPPTSGQVSVFGTQPIVGRADVGYMFARDALLPWRTARQNVELALELRGVGRHSRRERAATLLDRVHLSSAADQFPAELSQGMRQRVALARTWATDPRLLLMDEPFAALDAQTRAAVRGEFLSIWDDEARRKTVLFVTHDLSEALILADRVVVVVAGNIVADVDLPDERPRELGSVITRTDVRALYHDLERAMDPRSSP